MTRKRIGGLPVGKAGRSPTRTTRRQNSRPGPKKLNQAGYGTAANPKGPPKGGRPGTPYWFDE